jgi:hypothetical protein
MSGFIETITYTLVDAADDGRIALAAISDDPSARDIPHALVFVRDADGTWSGCQLSNQLVGIYLSQPGEPFDAVGIGIDGGICRITGSEQTWGLMEEGSEGPNTLVPLITSRRIGGTIVAAGMQRRVYADGPSGWSRLDEGVRIASDDLAIGGFLSIDGTSPELLWAAGYGGELWHRNGSSWERVDGPSEDKLVMVHQRHDGSILLADNTGRAFLGTAGDWRPITGVDSSAVIAIEEFLGRTYVSVRGGALFVLGQDKLERVDECGSFPVYAMSASTRSLIAVGPLGLLELNADGWHEASPPVPVGKV